MYLPDSLEAKAKEDEWCCYIYGEMDETSLYVMCRHGDLADIYGASEQVVASAADYLKRHLTVLAHHLEGREPLMGEQMRHIGPPHNGVASAFFSCNRGKESISLDLKSE